MPVHSRTANSKGKVPYTFWSDGSTVKGDLKHGKPQQEKYADVSGQKIGQYINGIWHGN